MRYILIIYLSFFITGFSLSQEKLTLEKAIGIALHKNSQLLISTSQIEGYESSVQAAYGNFLPSLGLNAGWDWSRSDVKGVGTVVINGIPVPRVSTTSTSRNYRGSVYTDWTLFDGLANFAQLSKTENELQSAQYSLERVKQDIVFQTMSLYYDVVYAEQLLRVKKADLKWNEKNLETIKERNRLGAATLADVYQQEVAKGNAELELIKTENQLEISKKDLLFYLGEDILQEFVFSDTLTSAETEILNSDLLNDYENITELVTQALNKRFDYQSAVLNFESSKEGVTIAESGHWPSLTANGNYSLYTDNLSTIDQSKTLGFGLSLNIPLFSGWSVTNRVQLAEVQSKISEVEKSDLERDIKRQIKTTFLNLQAAQKGLGVSEKNIAAARENLKIEEEKYSLGSGKLLDVLIVNSRYTDALTSLLNAQFAYIVLSQQMRYYLGILDYKIYEQQ
ncbi:MAG: TolC family protein [Ignavibacteriota bacterium]|jgi:outer membrane protein|nr:MAG: TolC family protein [Chlorobiota bacterium]MBE7478196.1 TolC family protein [Ignavibacteriales bacterium]MBL1121574.1 TolC family protein [Ignavibacteriota bacterium]MCC7093616.1 TolC family protein [Ignavibacteriaceae bacterium]MCE7855246.1 TolC family protein [Ignavibacteria bacterium CHB3]MEB2296093.1 TolC family protein [Ignavibacteria bacterium]